MSVVSKAKRMLADEGLGGLFGKVFARIRRALFELSPRRFRHRRAEREFDRRIDVDTGGIVRLESLAIEGDTWEEGVRYQPTSIRAFRHMIERLPIDLAEFTFVDVGSGKGRAIFLAAEFDFQRIIGVEFSEELHRVAQANVERFRAAGSTAPFELVREDATRYAFPDEPTVVYMYNPFTGSVAERFFAALIASVETRFRDVIVVYNNPTAEQHLADAAVFEKIDEGLGYVTYRSRRP